LQVISLSVNIEMSYAINEFELNLLRDFYVFSFYVVTALCTGLLE